MLQVLGKLPGLRNLCLAGCPLASASNYQASMLSLSSSITILDGKQLEGHFKPRRPKLVTSAEPAAAAQATAAGTGGAGHAPASDRPQAKHEASSDQQPRQRLPGQDHADRPNPLGAVDENGIGKPRAKDNKPSKRLRPKGGDDADMPVKDSQQKAGKRHRTDFNDAAPALPSSSGSKKVRKVQHGPAGGALQHVQAEKAPSALPKSSHNKQSRSRHVRSEQQQPLPADGAASAVEGASQQQQQQQQASRPGEAVPAIGKKDKKKRRLDVQPHAEIKGSSKTTQSVEEHRQSAEGQPAAALVLDTRPDAASAAPSRRRHDRKLQHIAADKRTGTSQAAEPPEDEDRVVELQPMALPKLREQAQSGVLGVVEARGRQARAGPQRAAGQPTRDRSQASKAGNHQSSLTKPITGAAAAQMLMQQAQAAAADIDDLPGW